MTGKIIIAREPMVKPAEVTETDVAFEIKSEDRVTSIPKIRPKNKLIIADKLAREIIPTLLILTFSK